MCLMELLPFLEREEFSFLHRQVLGKPVDIEVPPRGFYLKGFQIVKLKVGNLGEKAKHQLPFLRISRKLPSEILTQPGKLLFFQA